MTEIETLNSTVSLSRAFFEDVLPRVRDLTELRVVLFVAYLAAQRGTVGVPLAEILAPAVSRKVVGQDSPEPAEHRLRSALDRAVANGVLFRIGLKVADQRVRYFVPVTETNRELIGGLRQNDPEATAFLGLDPAAEAIIYRPNVFAVYEQHIGPLTPLLAEQLRDAERSYPRRWIEEAILAAARYNKRNWRYIETILTRWEETGGPHGAPG